MESKQKSLKVNSIMNAILSVSALIFPLITFPYVSRIIGPSGTGKVSFANSVVSYFLMLSQLGMPTYAVITCSKVRLDREKLTRTVQELLIISVLTCVISGFLLFILVINVDKLYNEKILYLIAGSTILLTTVGVEWLYKALELYSYITIRSIAFKIVALLAMFMLVKTEDDYVFYCGISVFASSASYLCNIACIHKYICLKPIGNYNLKRHLRPIFTFFAISCVATIYTNLDTVMLGFMKSDIDVGYYNAAVKVKQILVSVVTSLSVVLLPRAAYYIENKKYTEYKIITQKAFNFIVLLSFPLAVFFTVFSEEAICLLSGVKYEGAIVPMQIIMPTVLLIGLSNLIGGQVLIPIGKEKELLYAEIIGALLDVFINILLIPKLSSTGAAIGTLFAELCVTLICAWRSKEIIGNIIIQVNYLRIIMALILGIVASTWVKLMEFSFLTTLIISSILFFGTYGGYMLLRKETMVVEVWNYFFLFMKKCINKLR